MMRSNKIRWLFTAIGIGLFLLIGGAIPDDPLGDRAMSIGLGVDLSPSGEIVASAQILTAAESTDTDAGTRVVSASGKLLNTAISNLTETCGQTLTVTHCNVVLLGSTLVDSGKALDVLYTLLENTYVSDNAYVFACEGTPEDVFTSKSAFGQNSSRYLQQLVSLYGTYENIAYRTLAQVLVGHESIGASTYMPYVVKKEVPAKIPSSSSFDSLSDSPDYAFDLNAVLVLKNARKVGVYGEHALRAINYILTEVHKGSEDFDIPGGSVGFFILDNKVKQSLSRDPAVYTVDLEIGVTVKDYHPDKSSPRQDGTFSYVPTDADKKACERSLHDEISSFFSSMQSLDVDVFSLKQKYYSRYGVPDLPLSDVTLRLTVRLSVEK